jgi:hypothetical protein
MMNKSNDYSSVFASFAVANSGIIQYNRDQSYYSLNLFPHKVVYFLNSILFFGALIGARRFSGESGGGFTASAKCVVPRESQKRAA